MENCEHYPHYVALAVMVVNPKLSQLQSPSRTEKVIPLSILASELEDDMYELPGTFMTGSDKSMEECAGRIFKSLFGDVTVPSMEEIKTYFIPGDGNSKGYMVTAYGLTLVPAVGQSPFPKVLLTDIKTVWRGLNAMRYSMMGRGQNEVLSTIISKYSNSHEPTYESSLDVIARPPHIIGELKSDTGRLETVTEIDGLFKNIKDSDKRDSIVSNLQRMGCNIYPHPHKQVATDVVAFGYYDFDPDDKQEEKSSKELLELSVLLVHRTDEPSPFREGGKWALPGTFLREKESAEAAANRVLGEEGGFSGGIKPTAFYPLRPFSNPDRDTEENSPVISLPFFWIVPKKDVSDYKAPSKSTTECRWFTIKRTLYAGHDSEGKEIIIRQDNMVKVFNSKSGQYEELENRNDKSNRQQVLRNKETGIPITKIYILDNVLHIDYFVDEEFDSEDYIRAGRKKAELAFDHGQILITALETLKEQTHFRPLFKGLLPEQFSPTLIWRLWESIYWPWTFARSNWQNGIKVHDESEQLEGKYKKKGFIRRTEGSKKIKGGSMYVLDEALYDAVLEDSMSIL